MPVIIMNPQGQGSPGDICRRSHLTNKPRQGNAPTDGGWGWVVAIASGVMQAVSCGPAPMAYVLFERIFGNDTNTGGVATIMSVFSAVTAFSGLFMVHIQKRFGLKVAGLTGAVAVCLGNVGGIFAQSYWQLLISYGVLIGFGFGCMSFAGMINVNDYFVERRTVAMGVLHVTNMTISMLYPVLIRILIENFGREGAQIIITAIGVHGIAAALLLRPNTKIQSVDQSQQLLTKNDREKELEEVLLVPHSYTATKTEKCSTRRWNICRTVMDSDTIRIMRQPDFQLLSGGVVCVLSTELIFFSLHPVYLLSQLSLSLQQTSFILAATGAGDFVGRALLMISGKYLANSNKLIFWFAAIGTSVLITGFTLLTDYISVTILSAILGNFRGIIYVTTCLVFSEHYSVEVFPVALTTNSFISCAVIMILGPLFGQLRDYTGSYLLTFVSLACLSSVCTTLWLAQAVIKYYRNSRNVTITKL